MIPDKIYINAEAALDLAYNPGEDDSKVEYIRKKALLKWLKDNAPIEASVYGFMGGYMAAYKQVIDKLNSM